MLSQFRLAGFLSATSRRNAPSLHSLWTSSLVTSDPSTSPFSSPHLCRNHILLADSPLASDRSGTAVCRQHIPRRYCVQQLGRFPEFRHSHSASTPSPAFPRKSRSRAFALLLGGCTALTPQWSSGPGLARPRLRGNPDMIERPRTRRRTPHMPGSIGCPAHKRC